MDDRDRRMCERVKDDYRLCRATLSDDSGETAELSVIDISEAGAAVCDWRDNTAIPSGDLCALTKGKITMRVPTPTKRNTNMTIRIGEYEVVREWPNGPGCDAGIALRFSNMKSGWEILMRDARFANSLANPDQI